jgi:hypothetical protein
MVKNELERRATEDNIPLLQKDTLKKYIEKVSQEYPAA